MGTTVEYPGKFGQIPTNNFNRSLNFVVHRKRFFGGGVTYNPIHKFSSELNRRAAFRGKLTTLGAMALEDGVSVSALMAVGTVGGLSILGRIVERVLELHAIAPSRYTVPLAHSATQIIWNIAEISFAILMVTTASFLQDYWTYLFFGFFLHDGIEIVCRWPLFSPAFRTFVLKHHIMSVAIAMMWMLIRNFTSIQLGSSIPAVIFTWDASSGLSDTMFWYDCLRKGAELRNLNITKLTATQLAARRYKIFVTGCIVQRVWRIAAYVAGCAILFTSDLSRLALAIVLAPALLMDAVDCNGQYGTYLSLRKARDTATGTTEKSANTPEELEVDLDGRSTRSEVVVAVEFGKL